MLSLFLVLVQLLFASGLQNRRLDAGVSKRIPRIMFRSFDDPLTDLDSRFEAIFNKTLGDNSEYVIVYVDAKEREHFVERHYPAYLERFRSLIPSAYKNDVFRQLIVYKFGGIYNDMGINYIAKLSDIFHDDDEFCGAVDLDPTAMINGFFAAHARHPLIKQTIVMMMDNINHERYGCSNLDITGPKVFGRAFHKLYDMEPSEPIRPGRYLMGSHQYHWMQFVKTGANFTLEEHDRPLVRNKFEGYHEAVYRNNSQVYGRYWAARKVYDIAHTNKTLASKHEGQLVRNNNPKFLGGPTFWYVIGGKRRAFPSKKVFAEAGFERCMGPKKYYRSMLRIPLGRPFSTNREDNLRDIQSIVFRPRYLDELDAKEDPVKVTRAVQGVVDKFKGHVITYRQFIDSMRHEM